MLDATHTLSTSLSTGITLTLNGAYLTPFTVTSTGTIATDTAGYDVVSGVAGASLANAGVLTNSGRNSYGVGLDDGSLLNSGFISASTAVVLNNGGFADNTGTAAYIGGSLIGIDVRHGSGTILNAGTIIGGNTGLYLQGGGTVMNNGTIAGKNGDGVQGQGIDLDNTSGTITGGAGGAGFASTYGSLTNYGAIVGGAGRSIGVAGGAGVFVTNAGILSNHSYIGGGAGSTGGRGGDALEIVIGGTFNNDGALVGGAGGNGGASSYQAGGNGGAGAYLHGSSQQAVLINRGIIAGGNGGTQGAGSPVSAEGTGGVGVLLDHGTLINAGLIAGGLEAYRKSHADAVLFSGSYASTLDLEPGAGFFGNVVATAGIEDVLELTGTFAIAGIGTSIQNFSEISFDPGAAWIITGNANGLAAGQTIAGFAHQDTIDLTGVAATAESFSNGVLTLTAGGTVLAGLTIAAPPAYSDSSHFFISSDGNGGTNITTDIPCFGAGTRIGTPRGETAVEDLAIGNLVNTAFGGARPVTWLGSWHVDLTDHADPQAVWPVRIAAGALAAGVPRQALHVSPQHALYLDGVLVPARLLINGETITQPPRGGALTYYHVQVDPHDILYAEGAEVESFLDRGCALFGKPAEEPKTWEDACAPLVIAGPLLQTIRRTLAARTGAAADDTAHRDLPGMLLVAD